MKLIKTIDGQPYAQPDPFIFAYGNKFYIYATNSNGVIAYRSSSLFNGWEYIGYVLETEGIKSYWAPCVIALNDKFYMYYSAIPAGEENVHRHCIKVAVSNFPDRGFVYEKDILQPFSIDAQVVKNESGLYLFYSTNRYEGDRVGTYIAVDKMIDPFTVEGNPVPAVLPTLDEEIFAKDRFRKGEDWHTIEGACYFHKGNDHYILYSGGNYKSKSYFLGYAYAESTETDLRRIVFQKQPKPNIYKPLLSENEVEEGAGHNSFITVGANDYLVYHACDKGKTGYMNRDNRTARICRLCVDGASLKVEQI